MFKKKVLDLVFQYCKDTADLCFIFNCVNFFLTNVSFDKVNFKKVT